MLDVLCTTFNKLTSSPELLAPEHYSIVSDEKVARGNRVELRGYKPHRADDISYFVLRT